MLDDEPFVGHGFTGRLAAAALPLGIADLVIAALARWAGHHDHIALYVLAGLTFLVAPLLIAGHFFGGDIIAAAQLRQLRKLYAERFPFSGPRRDWRFGALAIAAILIAFFVSPRDRITGAALLAVAAAWAAMAASYVTRVWPDGHR